VAARLNFAGCPEHGKVARSVIANDRDAATCWDGRQLTGQIDPNRTFKHIRGVVREVP
jgi:hypothetical protein